MISFSKNPTKVLSDADNINNTEGQRMATVLAKHISGFTLTDPEDGDKVKTLTVDRNGDVSWKLTSENAALEALELAREAKAEADQSIEDAGKALEDANGAIDTANAASEAAQEAAGQVTGKLDKAFSTQLADTATEADLTSGNYLALDGSSTKKLPAEYLIHSLKNIYNTSTYASMDDLPISSACLVSTSLTNKPEGVGGCLAFTFGASNTTSYASQLCVSVGNDFYFRTKRAGTWSAWSKVSTFNPSTIVKEFSVLNNYAIGDYVYYNDELVKFKQAHSAGPVSSSEITSATTFNDVCFFSEGSSTNFNNLTSMNDAPVGIMLVNTTLSDKPSGFGNSGILVTYASSRGSSYKAQILIDVNFNHFAFRAYYSGTWRDWKILDELVPDYSYLDDYCNILADELFLNYVVGTPSVAVADSYINTSSGVSSASGYSISDTITVNAGETIAIYAGGYNTNVVMIALWDGSNYTKKVTCVESAKHVYTYTNTTTSTQNVRLSYRDQRAPHIYFVGKRKEYEEIVLPELSVFETIGVIGDSYASGVIYNSAGTDHSTFYNKSWPQILGRKNGITATNYSFGGARTNTWLTNDTYGLAKLLSDPALDAYAIVLSINDRNKGGAEWLGTIADIHVGNPSLNADSFYGCYGKIIENILSHAPNSKIFCVQHAGNSAGLQKDYNDAIASIASLYNLPCIPEFEDPFFATAVYTEMYGGHPTYVGYAGMADALCRLMRKAMVAYKDYFKQYVPIT